MSFKDRCEAGKKLAKALKRYEGQRPVILALPRGGVPVAAEVAAALHAPLGLVLVRKIGVPMATGIGDGRRRRRRRSDHCPQRGRHSTRWRSTKPNSNKFAIGSSPKSNADVGAISAIACPSTSKTESRSSSMTESPQARQPERPCAPHACARRRRSFLRFPSRRPRPWPTSGKEADDVICLEAHEFLGAIGFYYSDFRQTSDEEVIEAIARYSSDAKVEKPTLRFRDRRRAPSSLRISRDASLRADALAGFPHEGGRLRHRRRDGAISGRVRPLRRRAFRACPPASRSFDRLVLLRRNFRLDLDGFDFDEFRRLVDAFIVGIAPSAPLGKSGGDSRRLQRRMGVPLIDEC